MITVMGLNYYFTFFSCPHIVCLPAAPLLSAFTSCPPASAWTLGTYRTLTVDTHKVLTRAHVHTWLMRLLSNSSQPFAKMKNQYLVKSIYDAHLQVHVYVCMCASPGCNCPIKTRSLPLTCSLSKPLGFSMCVSRSVWIFNESLSGLMDLFCGFNDSKQMLVKNKQKKIVVWHVKISV